MLVVYIIVMTIRTVLLILKQRTKETIIITWVLEDIRGNERIYNVLFLFRRKIEMLSEFRF